MISNRATGRSLSFEALPAEISPAPAARAGLESRRLVRTGFLEGMAAKGLTDPAYFKYISALSTLNEDGSFPYPTCTKVPPRIPDRKRAKGARMCDS